MNIEYVAQYGTSGYAVAAKGNILYLESQGHNVCFSPLMFDNSQIDKEWDVDKKVCSKIGNEINIDTQIIHTIPSLWDHLKNKRKKNYYYKKIGYCAWENTRLPKMWNEYINRMDEVWVPSNFNKKVFIESGVNININIFPHIFFDQTLPDKKQIHIKDCFDRVIPNDKFTLYCIGEYIERKGIKDLIKVYRKLSSKYKNIQLILKLYYNDYSDVNIKHLESQFSNNETIYPIIKNIDNQTLLKIHGLGDCYVSLHKGEGFGLCLYDAVNYNKKIAATAFGGPLDYLNESHKLIDFKLNNASNTELLYNKDQQWAYPNLDDAYNKIENIINDHS